MPTRQDFAAKVKAHLSALPTPARAHLTAIQSAFRAAAPSAEDAFAYGIPAVRVDGRILVDYAGWKAHSSLCPIGPSLLASLGVEGHETSKGTIRFPMPSRRPSPS